MNRTSKPILPHEPLLKYLATRQDLTCGEWQVCISLALYRNRKNIHCFPSQQTIANDAHLSRRGVQEIISRLCGKRKVLIRIRLKHPQSTHYFFIWDLLEAHHVLTQRNIPYPEFVRALDLYPGILQTKVPILKPLLIPVTTDSKPKSAMHSG